MKSYQAYHDRDSVIAETPRAAAAAFFDAYPRRRKCNIIEGVKDGYFFTVTYGRSSEGNWPLSLKDVTKKQIPTLP